MNQYPIPQFVQQEPGGLVLYIQVAAELQSG